MLLFLNMLPGPTRKEQQGSIVLVSVALGFTLLAPHVPDWFAPEPEDHSALLAQLHTEWDAIVHAQDSVKRGEGHASFEAATLFDFNPNGLPIDQWVALGFSRKQATSIHKYEAAGGYFRTKQDVQRLFVVSDQKYAQLEPYIHIPQNVSPPPIAPTYAKQNEQDELDVSASKKAVTLVDVNQADTLQLQKVKGIGAYTARQIVRLRERLGGFLSLEQLAEVKGMREQNLLRILPHLTLVETPVRRDLNAVDVEALGYHPYLSWNQARAIVNFRNQHGRFQSWSELLKIHLVSPQDTARLQAYFRLE